MEHEPGDDYIRRIAAHIRANEPGLAAAGYHRKRRTKTPATDNSFLNPLAWFGAPDTHTSVKPIVLSFDVHHLFYLLMRMEALGIDVGSLDVRVDSPSRPMNYVNLFPGSDKSDALSLRSFATSFSAVSRLSLGAGWWGRPAPPSVDAELKYIYSCFTKLPAISLHAPEPRLIAELANESPNENALPLDAFKFVQSLECLDIDPRTLLGWDRLAESLWSLTVKRSGLEDISDIFVAAVIDDQARREGKVKSTTSRRIRAPPSRQGSFYATRLPDSVPEDVEDAPSTPTQESTTAPDNASIISSSSGDPSKSKTGLSPLKWAFLRHLSLADNALTFLPSSPFLHLTSLTHLDLSSNLLVSVPSGLSALYNLVSLNLADNMIDSVLGIYTMLGQVLQLNLARNRLESICGLERLRALERVDLRNNYIEESAEVGRLATLPNIVEVYIEGNPLIEVEEGYRIRCFDLFMREGKDILLDGAPPGFYEKRYLSSPPPEQMTSSRPLSVAQSPPTVPVHSPPRPQAPPAMAPSLSDTSTVAAPSKESSSPNTSPPASSPPSQTASPHVAAVVGRGRRKKNKRIVDLDGGSETGGSRSGSHSRIASEAGAARATSPAKPSVLRPKEAVAVAPTAPAPVETAGPSKLPTSKPSSPPSFIASASPPRPKPKSRHSRHHTEFAPAPDTRSGIDDAAYARDDSNTHTPTQSTAHRRSATMSSKSAARRARISASVYEPPPGGGNGRGEVAGKQLDEAEAFRARIEALRSDMGDGWLKVFNQSHMSTPPAGVSSG